SPIGDSAADDEVMPCLGKWPSSTMIWHLPQVCRPPQMDSSSTPSARAASSSLAPCAACPRRPSGMKASVWVSDTGPNPKRSVSAAPFPKGKGEQTVDHGIRHGQSSATPELPGGAGPGAPGRG